MKEKEKEKGKEKKRKRKKKKRERKSEKGLTTTVLCTQAIRYLVRMNDDDE